jgi:hypothetical protein
LTKGGGKRRGEFIVASVNNKPQMSADDFSILQFVGSNFDFGSNGSFIEQKCCTRAKSLRPPR